MLIDISSELASAIIFLLPGFISAWIFYGLTSHPKPSQFERTVQALIFTFIVRALVPTVEWLSLIIGSEFGSGFVWTSASTEITSILLATALGFLLAYATNKDVFHKLLRRFGYTSRTSHPSEWFYIFSQKITFVILHLRDGRRLYGWPKEWPIEPNKGQFYIMLPSWIDADGAVIELPELDGILIQASDVQWVEFSADRGVSK